MGQRYLNVVTKVNFMLARQSVPKANDGPVPMLISTELTMARSGAIDADLLAQHPFYGTDYTKPLLFLEDGNYFSSLASDAAPLGCPVGGDERDRELPRPAVALALHAVVPGAGL